MSDRMRMWTEAMRTGRYVDAWALATETLAERVPGSADDSALPYHLRWVWDGRPFDDRDVLVRCYHGLGDTIQFARFLPILRRRAASVTVETPSRLIALLRSVDPDITFTPFDQAAPLPPAEVCLEITELDFALRAKPEVCVSPYLTAARAVLPRGTVALCYGSGDWDSERDVPVDLLGPLCTQGPCLSLVAEPTDLPVLNPKGCPFDMEATASLVAGADLVITVDTMIAHLAGALGRPTWLMLKCEPDWRWNPRQRHSSWYATMRLYVQPEPGDWRSVVAEVERDLAIRNTLIAEK